METWPEMASLDHFHIQSTGTDDDWLAIGLHSALRWYISSFFSVKILYRLVEVFFSVGWRRNYLSSHGAQGMLGSWSRHVKIRCTLDRRKCEVKRWDVCAVFSLLVPHNMVSCLSGCWGAFASELRRFGRPAGPRARWEGQWGIL